MRSVLIEKDREALGARIASLTPASSARWGRMTVDRALAYKHSDHHLWQFGA
jgi:hypothetical protein